MFHAVLDFGVAKARSYLMFVTSHQMNVSTAAHSNYRMTFKRKGNMDELLDVQGYLLWGRQKNLTFLCEGHVLWRPGGKLTFAGLYIVLPSDPCNLIGKQIPWVNSGHKIRNSHATITSKCDCLWNYIKISLLPELLCNSCYSNQQIYHQIFLKSKETREIDSVTFTDDKIETTQMVK